MLTPVGEHALLLFWVQLALLLGTARGLGALATRARQPAVVGELAAGLVLGPSVLGRVAPGLAERLFPGGEVESALILAVSWLGIVLLLAVTGFETDLGLLRRLGRASAGVSVGSLVVPFLAGFGLGLVLPASLVGGDVERTTFALFVAVALSISALPVVARILADMRLMRRDFGQITVAAGMVNDLVGWLLLGALTAIVTSGGLDVADLGVTVLALAVFVLLAFTAGQRLVDHALRRSRATGGTAASLTVIVLTVAAAGAFTHAIGMEAVIGAFLAGIVLARSRFLPETAAHTVEHVSNGVFAPVFFATAGLFVDLGALAEPSNALSALAILAVAALAKLVGSYVGGRVSRLSPTASLAVGVGLNARGAMEIVLAAVGLRLGVLNGASYSAIVLMAMATSMLAPPLLRPILRRLEASPEEARRLEREETLASSVIAKARHALLPTRGGRNAAEAARLLHLVLRPEAHVTVMTVETGPALDGHVAELVATLRDRSTDVRREPDRDPVDAIVGEAALGYDLVAVGLNEDFRGSHALSPRLQGLLARTPVPVLLVRRSTIPERGAIRRVVVPVSGTSTSRAAEELAYTLAARVDAAVDVVHVVERQPAGPDAAPGAVGQLTRARTLAERFGQGAATLLRHGTTAAEEIVAAANERAADLVLLGARLRTTDDGRPFLGYGVEHVLEAAAPTVAVVVFPPAGG